MALQIEQIVIGAIQSNCYIIWNDETREALIIDPGADIERILEFIDQEGLSIVAYPTTHGHYDHISKLSEIYDQRPAAIGLHPAALSWCFTSDYNSYPPYYERPEKPSKIEREWKDGETWTDAGFSYEIIHTPGHSPDGVCFYFKEEGLLIAGDTLFRGSMGRVDLPGSDPKLMPSSLARLMELPDEVVVYSGHGPATTIGHERRTNPYCL